MAADRSEVDDGYIHILARATDGSHDTQIFRMHRDKKLRALARSYASFRERPGEEDCFTMTSAKHGDLDLMATAASYDFCNGVEVTFAEVQPASGEPSERPVVVDVVTAKSDGKVDSPYSKGERGRGRFRRQLSSTIAKRARKASAAIARRARRSEERRGAEFLSSDESQDQTSQWARGCVYRYLPENMSATPDVDPSMCRSRTLTSGPANGWLITAYLRGHRSTGARKHPLAFNNTIGWRVSSPGRSRTFDTFTSSRGTPNLKDAVDEDVFTQITYAVKPELTKEIKHHRCIVEGKIPANRPRSAGTTPKRKVKEEVKGAPVSVKKERVTCKQELTAPRTPKPPTKRARVAREEAAEPQGSSSTSPRMRELPTPARHKKPPMKRECVAQEGVVEPEGCKAWGCDSLARLVRKRGCTAPTKLQPQLVYLRDNMTIGRADTCDIVMDSTRAPQMISRRHALLQQEGDAFILIDQGSMNGMCVNGARFKGKKLLFQGDRITFGVRTAVPELDYIFEMRPTFE